MSKAAPKASRLSWKYSAVGIPGTRSHATTVSEDPVTRAKWKIILVDLIQTLGGSNPMYESLETLSNLFQIRVSFRLPLKKAEGIYEDIVATGMECFTAWEAESEASFSALSRLQWGPLRTQVLDVSSARRVESEKRCNILLSQAGKLYYALKAVLAHWGETICKIEDCYRALHYQMAQGDSYTASNSTGKSIADVAGRLFELNRAAYVKHVELSMDSEEVQSLLFETHKRVDSDFRIPWNAEACAYRGDLPGEVKVRMKVILEEMLSSLGWAKPVFNTASSDIGFYICEVSFFPMDCYGRICGGTISITGVEGSSEPEATENCCEAAILFLEKEMTIYLVDLNYADRLDGKWYLSESKNVVYNIRLVGSKALAEWERLCREVKSCGEYYRNLSMKSSRNISRTELSQPTLGVALEELQTSCVASLQLAEKRFNNVVLRIGVDTWCQASCTSQRNQKSELMERASTIYLYTQHPLSRVTGEEKVNTCKPEESDGARRGMAQQAHTWTKRGQQQF